MNNDSKVDPILWMLFAGMFMFAGVLIFIEYAFKDDGQLFQVFSGMLTAFSGAFFMRVKPKDPPQPGDNIEHPIKVVATSITTGPEIPPEVKP